MKKNVIALSIATMIGGLGVAGVASAATVNVNESGTGQILVVPYFTTQAGNATGIHLTNTDTNNGKAVKIRIRGASNSDDLLDFQVLLSPGDVWTAALSSSENGLSRLVTKDNSCTIPAGVGAGEAGTSFSLARFAAVATPAESREGYIEILEMATIPAGSPLFTAIKHVSVAGKMTAPCTSATLAQLDAVDSTYNYAQDAVAVAAAAGAGGPAVTSAAYAFNQGLTAPVGALTAQWYVINVPNSTTFSGVATAIQATPDVGAGERNAVIYSPQLATGPVGLATADPLMVSGIMPAVPYDVPDLSTPMTEPAAAGANPDFAAAAAHANLLTTELSKVQVLNQYLVDPDLGGSTDWVFSMPTRRYTVAANYLSTDRTKYALANAGAAAGGVIGGANGFLTAEVAAPATAYRIFNLLSSSDQADGSGAAVTDFAVGATNSVVNSRGQICATSVAQAFWDTEESTQKPAGAVVSPSPTLVPLQACGEVSVLTLGTTAGAPSILGSSVAHSNVAVPGGYLRGWGSVSFDTGVPVLGAAFIKAVNDGAQAGMSGNYGLTWTHSYK